MRQSNFNLKRNTNPNKMEKKESAKINKFEQSIYQNGAMNFFIVVLTLFSSSFFELLTPQRPGFKNPPT